jgi:hypothetical protein
MLPVAISLLILIYLILPVGLAFESTDVPARNEWLLSIVILWALISFTNTRNRFLLLFLSVSLSILIYFNSGLSASYSTQGTGFNHQFFAHLDLSTLKIAWEAERSRLIVIILYIGVAPLAVYIGLKNKLGLPKTNSWNIFSQVILFGVALVLYINFNTPIRKFYEVYQYSNESDTRIQELMSLVPSVRTPVTAGDDKNVILIYLEGLEQNYLDKVLFPNLLPELNELREKSTSFSNLIQYPGTGWTIAGLVSSQCAVPLLSFRGGNTVLKQLDNPFSEIDCLAEYFKLVGYNTTYVGGASLEFAGKGSFLADNGFDTVLGLDEIPAYDRHGWGIFDQYLFDHMKELFDELALRETPFLLSALTLDTHHPTGTPSPNCTPYGSGDNAMLNAVHCTDQLVGDFVNHVRSSEVGDETLIVLLSDHLAIPKGVVDDLSRKERKLLFMILDPSQQSSQEFSGQASHFDIAPTILDSLKIEGAEFAFGHSLLENEEGKARQNGLNAQDFNAFRIEKLLDSF